MVRDDVVQLLYLLMDQANEMRDPEEYLVHSEDTVLYGAGSLDSLGLVSLILDLEAAIDERTGIRLTLADERAVSQRRNPFRDVRSLTDYLMERLGEVEACPPNPSS